MSEKAKPGQARVLNSCILIPIRSDLAVVDSLIGVDGMCICINTSSDVCQVPLCNLRAWHVFMDGLEQARGIHHSGMRSTYVKRAPGNYVDDGITYMSGSNRGMCMSFFLFSFMYPTL